MNAQIKELTDALKWALDQIEDDLDPDHQAAFAAARSLAENRAVIPVADGAQVSKHTAAPWLPCCETDGRSRVHYVKIGTGNCYMTRGVGQTEDEVMANARLIAAAPQMLSALDEIATGSKRKGRWLDESGEECEEGTPGAEWREYDEQEQCWWLESVAQIAAEAVDKATGGSA